MFPLVFFFMKKHFLSVTYLARSYRAAEKLLCALILAWGASAAVHLYFDMEWLPEILGTTLVLLGLVNLKLIFHSVYEGKFYSKINNKQHPVASDHLTDEVKYLYSGKDNDCLKSDDSAPNKNNIINDSQKNSEVDLLRAELQMQQIKSKTLLDSWPQGIIYIDKNQLISLNSAACEMLGVSKEQRTIRLNIGRYLPPTVRTRELDRIYALQQGLIQSQHIRSITLLRTDGSTFSAEVTEFLWQGCNEFEMVWLINDISRAQQMQKELEEANSQLKQLSQRLIEIQETERRQIARDLHDDIGQQLTGLKLYLQLLQRQTDNLNMKKTMQSLIEGTDQALAKVRSLSLSLHPLQLETLGLEAAIRWHLSHFLEATPTAWEIQIEGELESISSAKAVAAFRIVQEALNNIVKHAQADNLRIIMSRDTEGLRLEIMDDGCGFDTKDTTRSFHSLGLTSMRERVSSLGGHLTINSLERVGTRITAWLPSQSKALVK